MPEIIFPQKFTSPPGHSPSAQEQIRELERAWAKLQPDDLKHFEMDHNLQGYGVGIAGRALVLGLLDQLVSGIIDREKFGQLSGVEEFKGGNPWPLPSLRISSLLPKNFGLFVPAVWQLDFPSELFCDDLLTMLCLPANEGKFRCDEPTRNIIYQASEATLIEDVAKREVVSAWTCAALGIWRAICFSFEAYCPENYAKLDTDLRESSPPLSLAAADAGRKLIAYYEKEVFAHLTQKAQGQD